MKHPRNINRDVSGGDASLLTASGEVAGVRIANRLLTARRLPYITRRYLSDGSMALLYPERDTETVTAAELKPATDTTGDTPQSPPLGGTCHQGTAMSDSFVAFHPNGARAWTTELPDPAPLVPLAGDESTLYVAVSGRYGDGPCLLD